MRKSPTLTLIAMTSKFVAVVPSISILLDLDFYP